MAIQSGSFCYIGTAHWALVLPVPPHRRSRKLVDTPPMPEMTFAGEGLLGGPGDSLFTNHAGDLLLVDEAIDPRDPLISSNRGESLKS